jgi:hypothetical protein
VIAVKAPPGTIRIAVALPATAAQTVFSLVPNKALYISQRIAQKYADLMRHIPFHAIAMG